LSLILTSLTKLDDAFGRSLKIRRLTKLLSQEELAIASNLSRAYISDLETGKKDPSLFTVFKLSHGLKIKPSAFIAEVEHLSSGGQATNNQNSFIEKLLIVQKKT
jgi:transcriptional regulator with XRE-family HTH domain